MSEGAARVSGLRSAARAVAIVGLAVAAMPASGLGLARAQEQVASDPVAEPADYRLDEYRAPTPETLRGAIVVDTGQAMALHAEGVPFVDVMPRPPRPANLPEGTLWRPQPRHNIPGSLWLVDTGYGALAPVMERYLHDGLARATADDKAAPVVLYCQRECWMSWNAARHAVLAGYTAVHWYPDGTDGWKEAGGELVLAEPVDRPDE